MANELKPDLRHILTVIADHTDPWVTTVEVANQTDFVRRTVYNKLCELDQDGLVNSKQVGSNGRGWWLSEKGHAFAASRDDSVAVATGTSGQAETDSQQPAKNDEQAAPIPRAESPEPPTRKSPGEQEASDLQPDKQDDQEVWDWRNTDL